MIAITWVGHSTALIEIGGLRLLTDPLLGQRVGPLVRTGPPVPSELYDMVDAVLLSHLHADHADLPSLKRVDSPVVIAPRGTRHWFDGRVSGEVRDVGAGDEVHVGAVRVATTAAAHGGRRWPLVGVRTDPVGYVMTDSSGESVYFAGDTDLFPAMADLAGSIDVALLPVAGWGPTLGPGHLDPDRAAEAVVRIAPRVAVPIHWGTLAPRRPLRRHPHPGRPPREFAALVAQRAPGVDVRVLEPGGRTVVE